MEHSVLFSGINLITLTSSLVGLVGIILSINLFFSKKNTRENPITTLQKKFSNGEIDAYEYEQHKRQLQKEEDLKMKSFFLSSL